MHTTSPTEPSECPDLGTFKETPIQKAIREGHAYLQGIKERRAIEAKPYKPPIDYSSITRSVSG